jgi:uncharacterized tellurite resistance protein B-like protein
MSISMKNWFDSFGADDQIFHPKNPEKFKNSTAAIICSIINFSKVKDKEELCKFCDLFKQEFHIDEEAAQKLFKDSNYIKKNLTKHAQIVKDELNHDEYKLMRYMKMLNKYIIIDKCKDEDYDIFAELKTILFG